MVQRKSVLMPMLFVGVSRQGTRNTKKGPPGREQRKGKEQWQGGDRRRKGVEHREGGREERFPHFLESTAAVVN